MDKKKVSKEELRDIFETAHKIYVDSDRGELSSQQFMAKCYLRACARTLGIGGLEFEEKVPYSPADE